MSKSQATIIVFVIVLIVAAVAAWMRHESRLPVPEAPATPAVSSPDTRSSDPCAKNPALEGCAKGA